jgi:hypothetical protein
MVASPAVERPYRRHRDDEVGDPPENLADDAAGRRRAIPRHGRTHPQLRRRRACRAAPARDGRVAACPRRQGESRRTAASRPPPRARRGEDPLHGRAAPPEREVLRRDRPAAAREEGRARREHRRRVPLRPRGLSARDASGRPGRLRLGRGRPRRRPPREGRRLLRPRVRPPPRGGQGPRVHADPHDRARAAGRDGPHRHAPARPAGRLLRHPAGRSSRRAPRIPARAASTGTCCAR